MIKSIKEDQEVAIVYEKTNEIIATMVITEKYTIDREHECKTIYKTTDMEHPGVFLVMSQGKYNLAGPIKVLSDGGFPSQYGRPLYDTFSNSFLF